MISKESLSLSIENLDDLLRCLNLASSLEILGHPKPGNIHRTKNFEKTRIEHFFAGISAIQPNFRDLCSHIYNNFNNLIENYSFIQLGKFIKEAAQEMMDWQSGGNVLLGHILILAPLAAAATLCLKAEKKTFNNFINFLKKIIDDTTIDDTINLYEAMRVCSPGGLGKITKYDINEYNSIKDIKNDKITLKKIFELSKDYDSISLEYSNDFNIILNEGFPYFLEIFNQVDDINISTVNTFLWILAEHPDTLIRRKSGKKSSLMVSQKASIIFKNGGLTTKKGIRLTKKLDKYLQKFHGKLNPGTTADLVAGVLFCSLIFGMRF